MPKTTIYIPDQLWGEVRSRAASQKASVSQLIQTALNSHLGLDQPRPPFAQSPPPIPAEIAARLQERLTREARETYESGFTYGLRLAERLNWHQLDRLATLDWNFGRWRKTGDDVGEILLEFEQDEDPVMFDLLTSGEDVVLVHPLSFRQGMTDALKAVWSSVAAPKVAEPDTEGGEELAPTTDSSVPF